MATNPMPIVDGVIYVKTLVEAMDSAGLFALEYAAIIVNKLRPTILLSFMLYILLWGWAMMEGVIKENIVQDGVARILKLAMVMGLVLGFGGSVDVSGIVAPGLDSTGAASNGIYAIGAGQNNTLYTKYVYDFIWNAPEQMFKEVTGMHTNTLVMVTQAVSFLYTLGFDYWQEGVKLGSEDINLVMFGLGGVTILAGTVLAATIITTVLFAKLMLSILLAVGPIFIVLFLFGGTRRLFEAWLGQLLSNVILIVLFGLAINIVLNMLWTVLGAEAAAFMAAEVTSSLTSWVFGTTDAGATPNPAKGLGIVMICYICHQLLAKIPPIADSIGRSLSLNLQTGLAR